MPQYMKNLSPSERREQIVELLKKSGSVRVSELSDLFSTSEVTIRNDLAELESSGLLQRVHGGAIQTTRNYYALDYSERLKERQIQKLEIARAVSNLVKDGDSIIMNSGSTNYYIAMELRRKRKLRIITNAIQIASIFAANRDQEVVLLGGQMNYQYMFTHGDDAADQLDRYKVDKTILSADGVDLVNGVTTYHNEVAKLCRLMIAKAGVTVIAADHTKLGHTAFSAVAGLDQVDYLATDRASLNYNLQEFNQLGIEILTAEPERLQAASNT